MLHQDITNTLPDTVLTDVSILCTPTDAEESDDDNPPASTLLTEEFIIPAPRLTTNEPGTVYVSFSTPADHKVIAAGFSNVLKFMSREIDPATGEPEETGYEDEYPVEDLELVGADYVVPAFAGSWDEVWGRLEGGEVREVRETLVLGEVKGIEGE